jgi:selenocysteine lyase/cysteine desulfurase
VSECLSGLRALGVDLLSPTDPARLAGILAFRHPRADALHRFLHDRQIHVMHHAGRLRVAFHGYNTEADVATFLREFASALATV